MAKLNNDISMFDLHMRIRQSLLKYLSDYREFHCDNTTTHTSLIFSMEQLNELIKLLTETDAIQNAYKLGYEQGTKDTKKSIAESFETFKKSMEV